MSGSFVRAEANEERRGAATWVAAGRGDSCGKPGARLLITRGPRNLEQLKELGGGLPLRFREDSNREVDRALEWVGRLCGDVGGHQERKRQCSRALLEWSDARPVTGAALSYEIVMTLPRSCRDCSAASSSLTTRKPAAPSLIQASDRSSMQSRK